VVGVLAGGRDTDPTPQDVPFCNVWVAEEVAHHVEGALRRRRISAGGTPRITSVVTHQLLW
jgi:hypothetical protein